VKFCCSIFTAYEHKPVQSTVYNYFTAIKGRGDFIVSTRKAYGVVVLAIELFAEAVEFSAQQSSFCRQTNRRHCEEDNQAIGTHNTLYCIRYTLHITTERKYRTSTRPIELLICCSPMPITCVKHHMYSTV